MATILLDGVETTISDAIASGMAAASQSVAQEAAMALSIGSQVTLTSTATPALNGNYLITPKAMSDLKAVQIGILSGIGLPGGGSTLPYPDVTGADHEFTATQITAFAGAVMGYVFALDRCAQGKENALPSSALSIA